jgi:hypothetical protein
LIDQEIAAFPTINRDEELLAQNPPVVILQFEGEASTVRVLLKLETAKHIKLVQIDTAIFAFEPVLKALQEIKSFPLSRELLFWKDDSIVECLPLQNRTTNIIEAIRANPYQDLQGLLSTPTPVVLDKSQAASLLSGLTQKVSLIQGPPGMINLIHLSIIG